MVVPARIRQAGREHRAPARSRLETHHLAQAAGEEEHAGIASCGGGRRAAGPASAPRGRDHRRRQRHAQHPGAVERGQSEAAGHLRHLQQWRAIRSSSSAKPFHGPAERLRGSSAFGILKPIPTSDSAAAAGRCWSTPQGNTQCPLRCQWVSSTRNAQPLPCRLAKTRTPAYAWAFPGTGSIDVQPRQLPLSSWTRWFGNRFCRS